jgi:hypothetical protein
MHSLSTRRQREVSRLPLSSCQAGILGLGRIGLDAGDEGGSAEVGGVALKKLAVVVAGETVRFTREAE